MRLSRKTLISFSISTLKFSLRTLILILNSQKFSNSHSRISTINSRISEKSQPISYCGRKKCLKSRELYIALYHKRPLDWYAFKTMLLLLKDTMQVFKSPSQRWALILEKLRVSFSFSLVFNRRSIDLRGAQEKEGHFHYKNFLRASNLGITCHTCSIIAKSLYCGLGLIPIVYGM